MTSASDDPAGLAVWTGRDLETRVYTAAVRNIREGVSFLSVTEGALSVLGEMATRREEFASRAVRSYPSGRAGEGELPDVDRDGQRDLVTVRSGFDRPVVYPGNGDGSFVAGRSSRLWRLRR